MEQRQKILVVDDDQISLDVNTLLLKGIGADIVTAMSGDEAIKKTIVEDFDLILMDVMMPGIDGFEAIEAIRKDQRNNAIPVIFITSIDGDELPIIKGLTLGAIDFITKPVKKGILRLKATNLLELQRNKRELELTARRLDQKIIEVEELSIKEQLHAKKAHEIIMQACMDGILLPLEIGTRYNRDIDQMYVFAKDITMRKLREKTQAELEKTIAEKDSLIAELNKSLATIKTLGSILPICSCCKKIRDDKGYWEQVDTYIRNHSDAQFSHSICPDCAKELYPNLPL